MLGAAIWARGELAGGAIGAIVARAAAVDARTAVVTVGVARLLGAARAEPRLVTLARAVDAPAVAAAVGRAPTRGAVGAQKAGTAAADAGGGVAVAVV